MQLLTIKKEDTRNQQEITVNLDQICVIKKQRLANPSKDGSGECFLISFSSGESIEIVSLDVIKKIQALNAKAQIEIIEKTRSKKS